MPEAATTPLPGVGTAPMVPVPHRVAWVRRESADTVTLGVVPQRPSDLLPRPLPGQFQMLYAFGVGEAPISVSGVPADPGSPVEHTVRAVGAVSHALTALEEGQALGARGPFGKPFRTPTGGTLLIVAGGLGLAPLRPAVLDAVARRDDYERVVVVIGARSPSALLWRDQIAAWANHEGVEVMVTVDAAPSGWDGEVGPVTVSLRRAVLDPADTVAMVCGPEVMMRIVADDLVATGVDPAAVQVSLERSMACAVALCGRCQLGAELVCRDGAVVPYAQVRRAMQVPQR